MHQWLGETVFSGSLLVAAPVALVAGLLSFFSPCVLPLLPGYFSYTSGLSGGEIASGSASRGRMVAGACLFVFGFGLVFTLLGLGAGSLGRWESAHDRTSEIALGCMTIIFGVATIGAIPLLSREYRIHRIPSVGLAAAPVIGALFGLGWLPCTGPTLGAILTLASISGGAVRGGLLLSIYSLGLGIPFIVFALAWRKALGALTFFRRHGRVVPCVAGAMMIVVGLALISGWWSYGIQWLQSHLTDHWTGIEF